jgi:hypothetical protein
MSLLTRLRRGTTPMGREAPCCLDDTVSSPGSRRGALARNAGRSSRGGFSSAHASSFSLCHGAFPLQFRTGSRRFCQLFSSCPIIAYSIGSDAVRWAQPGPASSEHAPSHPCAAGLCPAGFPHRLPRPCSPASSTTIGPLVPQTSATHRSWGRACDAQPSARRKARFLGFRARTTRRRPTCHPGFGWNTSARRRVPTLAFVSHRAHALCWSKWRGVSFSSDSSFFGLCWHSPDFAQLPFV